MPFRVVEPIMAAGGKISLGAHSLGIPAAGSLSVEAAEAWMQKAGSELNKLIDKTLSDQEKAWLKVQFDNAITVAGRKAVRRNNHRALRRI